MSCCGCFDDVSDGSVTEFVVCTDSGCVCRVDGEHDFVDLFEEGRGDGRGRRSSVTATSESGMGEDVAEDSDAMSSANRVCASDSDQALIVDGAPIATVGDVFAAVMGWVALGVVEAIDDIDVGAEDRLRCGVAGSESVAGDQHPHHALDFAERVDGFEGGYMVGIGDGEGGRISRVELKDGGSAFDRASDGRGEAESAMGMADDGLATRGVAGVELRLIPSVIVELSERVCRVVAICLKVTGEPLAIVDRNDGHLSSCCAESHGSHRERHGGNVNGSLGSASRWARR